MRPGLEPGKAAEVVGEVDERDLGGRPGEADGPEVVSRLFRTLVADVLRLSHQGVSLLEQFHVQILFGRPPRGGDCDIA